MEVVKELPKELQNKIFDFAAEHPAAALLKRDWFCQFSLQAQTHWTTRVPYGQQVRLLQGEHLRLLLPL
jgi:hypothetical protein